MEKNSKKIKVLWALLCQSASIDQQTNTLSVFNIIEELNLNQTRISDPKLAGMVQIIDLSEKTNVPTNFSLIVMTEKEDGFGIDRSPSMRIQFNAPDGEEYINNEFPLIPNSPNDTKIRAIVNFNGMIVKKSGRYTYNIYTKQGSDNYEKEFTTSVDIKIHP